MACGRGSCRIWYYPSYATVLKDGDADLGFLKVTSIELCAWLGGLDEYKSATTTFLTIEEVGQFLDGRLPD